MWIIHAGLRLPERFIGSGGIPMTADAALFNGYANDNAAMLNLREHTTVKAVTRLKVCHLAGFAASVSSF